MMKTDVALVLSVLAALLSLGLDKSVLMPAIVRWVIVAQIAVILVLIAWNF